MGRLGPGPVPEYVLLNRGVSRSGYLAQRKTPGGPGRIAGAVGRLADPDRARVGSAGPLEGDAAVKPLKKLLGGALLIEHSRFEDSRGSFRVLYESGAAESMGLPTDFVQDNASRSGPAGTVRGLHLQLPPWEQGKLIRVVAGRVFDVLVDLRPGSETHGAYDAVELSAADERQLWIPPGFAHGFCTLEPETEVFYKVDAPYRPDFERTLAWDDPTLAIDWPIEPSAAVLSDKDAAGTPLAEIVEAITRAGTGATPGATAEQPDPGADGGAR